MKLITAIIKPFKLDDLRQTVAHIGVQGLTVTEVSASAVSSATSSDTGARRTASICSPDAGRGRRRRHDRRGGDRGDRQRGAHRSFRRREDLRRKASPVVRIRTGETGAERSSRPQPNRESKPRANQEKPSDSSRKSRCDRLPCAACCCSPTRSRPGGAGARHRQHGVDAHRDGAGAPHDHARPRALLRRHGPREERAVGADAVLRGHGSASRCSGCSTATAWRSIPPGMAGGEVDLHSFYGGLGKAFMAGVGLDSLTGTIPESVFVDFPADLRDHHAGADRRRLRRAHEVLGAAALHRALVHLRLHRDDAHGLERRTARCMWDWGVLDFAGGTVVHINAGIAGLVAALVLGKRKGYPTTPMPPHNLALTVIGASHAVGRLVRLQRRQRRERRAVRRHGDARDADRDRRRGARLDVHRVAVARQALACWASPRAPSPGSSRSRPPPAPCGPMGALVIGLVGGRRSAFSPPLRLKRKLRLRRFAGCLRRARRRRHRRRDPDRRVRFSGAAAACGAPGEATMGGQLWIQIKGVCSRRLHGRAQPGAAQDRRLTWSGCGCRTRRRRSAWTSHCTTSAATTCDSPTRAAGQVRLPLPASAAGVRRSAQFFRDSFAVSRASGARGAGGRAAILLDSRGPTEAPTMKPTLTLLVAMLVAGGAQASDVFKTTDSAGRPVYTDRPATLPAQRLDVRTQTTDEVAGAAALRRADEDLRGARTRRAGQPGGRCRRRSEGERRLSATAKARRCEEAASATSRT